MDLKGRSFLTLKDFTKEEIESGGRAKKKEKRGDFDRYPKRKEYCSDF